jgi:hypothetical protein
MVKKKSKSKKSNFWKYVGKGGLLALKTPYYVGKGVYNLGKKTDEVVKERKVRKKREEMQPEFQDFDVLHVEKGDYHEWFDNVKGSDSMIGVILGARGTGKTAFGIKFLENLHSKTKRKCYAMGFDGESLPSWINNVGAVDELGNNSFVLIDEGGILFNSRNSMSNANKFLSELILVARHKNLSILFISQNSSNLEINILRQADFLILKPSSLLQKNFERKIIQKIYTEAEPHFEKFKDNRGVTHVYAGNFLGYVSNPLPSFWSTGLSKGFK